MDISHPANALPLAYLQRRGTNAPLLAAPGSSPRPYDSLGSHPDVVARVWDGLGKALPEDCRWIVCGTPGLVQPATGVLLALALGTQYALRLPGTLADEAVRRGWKTLTTWAGGTQLDTRGELGPEWVFGNYKPDELAWVRQAWQAYVPQGGPGC
jgi:hypothetical protein